MNKYQNTPELLRPKVAELYSAIVRAFPEVLQKQKRLSAETINRRLKLPDKNDTLGLAIQHTLQTLVNAKIEAYNKAIKKAQNEPSN